MKEETHVESGTINSITTVYAFEMMYFKLCILLCTVFRKGSVGRLL